jgi:hypothetical protein
MRNYISLKEKYDATVISKKEERLDCHLPVA